MIAPCFQFLIFMNYSLQIINIFIVLYVTDFYALFVEQKLTGLTLFPGTINTH